MRKLPSQGYFWPSYATKPPVLREALQLPAKLPHTAICSSCPLIEKLIMSFDGKSNIAVHARHQLQFVIAVEYIICLSHDTLPAHVEVSLTWLESNMLYPSAWLLHTPTCYFCPLVEKQCCAACAAHTVVTCDCCSAVGCVNAVLMLSAQRNA